MEAKQGGTGMPLRPKFSHVDGKDDNDPKNPLIRNSKIVNILLDGDDPIPGEPSIVLTGYLAKPLEDKPKKKWWRLYSSLDMGDYLEFREADTLWIVQTDTDDKPLGITVVWLRANATIRRTRPEPAQRQAEFLGGDITDTFITRALVQDYVDRRRQQIQILAAGSPGCGSPTPTGCST